MGYMGSDEIKWEFMSVKFNTSPHLEIGHSLLDIDY